MNAYEASAELAAIKQMLDAIAPLRGTHLKCDDIRSTTMVKVDEWAERMEARQATLVIALSGIEVTVHD